MNTRIALLALLASILVPAAALANSPAPWWACEGKTVGDDCDPYGGGNGICEARTDCQNDPETEVDECLRCDALPGDSEGGGCATVSVSSGALGVLGSILAALLRRTG